MQQPLPSEETMYNALRNSDTTYEGIFFVGVKTTGIFCRPTCHARKPKKDNVEFFPTTKDALEKGYRPCKKCQPLNFRGQMPDWLRPVIEECEQHPDRKIRDEDLRQRGLDPNRVRRWFKKVHGMTFQGFRRTLGISQAFGRIRHGETVLGAALESGYESLSGFADSFRKTTGFSPSDSKGKNVIFITRLITPLGPMLAGATERGICLLEFVDRRMIELQMKRTRSQFRADLLPGKSPLFDRLDQELKEYFSGTRRQFTVPLDIAGTEFQKKAWEALRKIPYGTTRSYKEQSGMLGMPTAVRAVARANGDNKIAIIIPCHRVVGADGKLVGYGGGLWRKKALLALESSRVAVRDPLRPKS